MCLNMTPPREYALRKCVLNSNLVTTRCTSVVALPLESPIMPDTYTNIEQNGTKRGSSFKLAAMIIVGIALLIAVIVGASMLFNRTTGVANGRDVTEPKKMSAVPRSDEGSQVCAIMSSAPGFAIGCARNAAGQYNCLRGDGPGCISTKAGCCNQCRWKDYETAQTNCCGWTECVGFYCNSSGCWGRGVGSATLKCGSNDIAYTKASCPLTSSAPGFAIGCARNAAGTAECLSAYGPGCVPVSLISGSIQCLWLDYDTAEVNCCGWTECVGFYCDGWGCWGRGAGSATRKWDDDAIAYSKVGVATVPAADTNQATFGSFDGSGSFDDSDGFEGAGVFGDSGGFSNSFGGSGGFADTADADTSGSFDGSGGFSGTESFGGSGGFALRWGTAGLSVAMILGLVAFKLVRRHRGFNTIPTVLEE